MIVWRREPNRGRQRQIRISSDPLEIDGNCYTDPISNVDSDGEVRFTLLQAKLHPYDHFERNR